MDALQQADVPNLLARASEYVAELQRQIAEQSQQLECAVRERRDARTALLVAKREGEVAVVNLRAEVARLRGELEDAAVEAAVQAQQLRAAEERGGALQASADAASTEGRKQAARMRARLEELQLVCTQQAQQLQALQAQPGRQPQVQQLERQLADQAAQLEHLQRAQAAAGELQLQQLATLAAERDEAIQRKEHYKRQVSRQTAAYNALKEKMQRNKRENAQALRHAQQQQEQQQQGQQQHKTEGGAQAVPAPAVLSRPRAASTSDDDSNQQLHLSVDEIALPGSSGNRNQRLPAHSAAEQQREGNSSNKAPGVCGAALAPPAALPRPPEPAHDTLPPAEEQAQGHGVPPTPLGDLPTTEEQEGEEDVELTQAVSPPRSGVVCTPAKQAPSPNQQQQLPACRLHAPLSAPELTCTKRLPQEQRAAQGTGSPGSKRQADAGVDDCAVIKRQSLSAPESSRELRPPPEDSRPPPPLLHRPAHEQPAAGRPTSRQPQQQRLPGTGWKQAMRDSTAAHTAFELGEPPAHGTMPPPPLRQANGLPAGGRIPGGAVAGTAGAGAVGYRYQAVVRQKAEREKLQGVECQQCRRFYCALESWGTIGQEHVRLACGHVQKASALASGAAGAPAPVDREQLRQEGSRHRYMWKPPDTQEGFWDMDVTQNPPSKHATASGQTS